MGRGLRWRRQRYHSGRGADAYLDKINGGDGIDTIKPLGSAPVTFANFSAHASSIEIWDGNGAGLVGTGAKNFFDLRGLTDQSGLSFIWAGAGNDVVFASDHGTTIYGSTGYDTLVGGAGDDTLYGGPNWDAVYGGGGNDTILVAGADAYLDKINGGDGIDTIKALGSAPVTFANFSAHASSIEIWDGNGAGLVGTGAKNFFDLRGLTDQTGLSSIWAGLETTLSSLPIMARRSMGAQGTTRLSVEQATILYGGPNWDAVYGGGGNDTILVAGADAYLDKINGGDGIDTIKPLGSAPVTFANFSAHASSIEIWDGNGAGLVGTKASNVFDLRGLTGQTGLAFVWGGNGNDTIFAANFDSKLYGGAGNSHPTGGAGNDILAGGLGRDVFTLHQNFGKDVIADFSPGQDQIAFDHSLFADYSQVIANASQVGNDVAISHGTDDLLTLKSVALSDLTDHDFSFV